MQTKKLEPKKRYYAVFMSSHPLRDCYVIVYATGSSAAFNAMARTFQGPFKLMEEEDFKQLVDQATKGFSSLILLIILKAEPHNKVTYYKHEAVIEEILEDVRNVMSN